MMGCRFTQYQFRKEKQNQIYLVSGIEAYCCNCLVVAVRNFG